MLDLDSFLVSLYVLVDDWWKLKHSSEPPRTGRPALLTDPEVITLAILAQWPRWRSERDFWRFAHAHLRPYFPNLCSQSQLNRRVRSMEPELRNFQRAVAETLCGVSEVYHVLDTTLIPAIVRVRASRKGLFAGQATFGRCVSKTEWVYGFKVALSVSPEGVICAFGLAEAASDERPIGDFQIIEGVIDQLKDLFVLERNRAKTLGGLLARLAAKMAAYTCGQRLNDQLGRPLRHLADLLVRAVMHHSS